MDQTPAILTVAATFMVGFGLIWAVSASIEKRSTLVPALMIIVGIGCAIYGFMLQPTLPEARLPLAFIEVIAMLTR